MLVPDQQNIKYRTAISLSKDISSIWSTEIFCNYFLNIMIIVIQCWIGKINLYGTAKLIAALRECL